MPTIVLAEDHPRTRSVLRQILEAEGDFTLVGEAGDGLEARRLTAELQPDVLVCDLVMPGLDGIALTEEIIRAAPRTRVLIVSNYIEQPYIHEAFKKGAAGYMDKVDCSAFLPEAVRTVMEGEKYLSPSLAWQSGPPGPSSMN